jgi:hypothetical protein
MADAEVPYLAATAAAFCDLQDAAIRLAQRAFAESYCAVDGLSRDPMFAAIRRRPAYPALLDEARACRERFVAGQTH